MTEFTLKTNVPPTVPEQILEYSEDSGATWKIFGRVRNGISPQYALDLARSAIPKICCDFFHVRIRPEQFSDLMHEEINND